MKSIKVLVILGLVIVLSMAACSTAATTPETENGANGANQNAAPNSGGTTSTEIPGGSGQPISTPAVPAGVSSLLSAAQLETIRVWVSQQLGQQSVNVSVVSVEEETWQDACLGLGQANESCLRADTPGYRVIISVEGRQHEVRTSSDLSIIRMAEVTP